MKIPVGKRPQVREPRTRAEVEQVLADVNLDAQLEPAGSERHTQLHRIIDHLLDKRERLPADA